MKKITQLNYYELLDLDTSATKADIQRSYCRLKKTYQADSLAIYSIVSGSEREYMETKIDEAYNVLMDDIKRHEYDKSLGLDRFQVVQDSKGSEPIFELIKIIEDHNNGTYEKKKEKEKGEEKGIEEETLDPLSRDFLKCYRQKRGISLREISEFTNIGINMLTCLEEGEYNKLPGRAYAIGFLREYSRYIGLDYQQAKENMEKWSHW